MPPSSTSITINVGGELFQTTTATLLRAGAASPLSSLPSSSFLDRDPSLFAPLLSLLRTGLPPTTHIPLPDLIQEARYYSLSDDLISALSLPSSFRGLSIVKRFSLPLPGRDPLSTLTTSASGTILAANAGIVTVFDPSLTHRTTILTLLPVIDSLHSFSSTMAAAGATDIPGLHILDMEKGNVVSTLNWDSHPSVSSVPSTVQAIGSNVEYLFTSFESSRRNASTIVMFDVKSLKAVGEIGTREVYGADLDSGIPATKLRWVAGFNVLMAAGSHRGPSGVVGNVRLWDVRSGKAVWEVCEKEDCFADVTVDEGLSAMFKVGVNSGEVFMSDLRKLSRVEPWRRLAGDGRRAVENVGKKEGSGCRIEAFGSQVFCTRGGDVEVWTEVAISGSVARRLEDGLDGERVMRRNVIGKSKDLGGSKIMQIAFGGNRMVVGRKDEHAVEVWESS